MNKIIVILISLLFLSCNLNHEESLVELKYIFTNVNRPDSFDPLDADTSKNLARMRMLYGTPIEINSSNILVSRILSSFNYDPNLKRIKFSLRKGQHYSDGSPITINDIAISIARMTFFRPDFPVIKDIVGVKKWLKKGVGLTELPEGMKIHADDLTIDFHHQQTNPLFRFCLELFSIIPSSCVDLPTGRLSCSIPPFSGYYEIESDRNSEIVFKKRLNLESIAEIVRYDRIQFLFTALSEYCEKPVPARSILVADEVSLLNSKCRNKFDVKQLSGLPSSRFAALVFNLDFTAFSNPENRRYFADKVREKLDSQKLNIEIQRGLFTKIVPGYVENKDFQPIDDEIKKGFKNLEVNLYRVDKSPYVIVHDAMIEVSKDLGMKVNIIRNPEEDITELFYNNKINIMIDVSGFWAQDPVGDISMYFTPGLHKSLKHIWNDKILQSYVSDLANEMDQVNQKSKLVSLNKYMDKQSMISCLFHFRKFYIGTNSKKQIELPQAITSPSPWHLVLDD